MRSSHGLPGAPPGVRTHPPSLEADERTISTRIRVTEGAPRGVHLMGNGGAGAGRGVSLIGRFDPPRDSLTGQNFLSSNL